MQHDLLSEIQDEVQRFNDNDDQKLEIWLIDEFVTLALDGKVLTSQEDFEVLKRVKQLNREMGYQYL